MSRSPFYPLPPSPFGRSSPWDPTAIRSCSARSSTRWPLALRNLVSLSIWRDPGSTMWLNGTISTCAKQEPFHPHRSTKSSARRQDLSRSRRSGPTYRCPRSRRVDFLSTIRRRISTSDRSRSTRSIRPSPRSRRFPADNPLVVSGDSGSLLPLAGSGYWRDGLRFWPTIPTRLTPFRRSQATWVITDGNQRRAVFFGRIDNNLSYLLGGGERLPGQAPGTPLSMGSHPSRTHRRWPPHWEPGRYWRPPTGRTLTKTTYRKVRRRPSTGILRRPGLPRVRKVRQVRWVSG